MNTVERLTKIVNSSRLRSNSKSFVESLLAQANGRELSAKQMEYVEKFWEECFPPQDILDAEQEWRNSFTDEMRENVAIVGKYYESNYPNSRLAKNYMNNEWVPDREFYEKTISTAWALTLVKNHKLPYRFAIGDTCVLRDTQANRSYFRDMVGDHLLVLDQQKDHKANFKSSYRVIQMSKMDDQRDFWILEDKINVYKEKKVKNG